MVKVVGTGGNEVGGVKSGEVTGRRVKARGLGTKVGHSDAEQVGD